MPNIGPVELLFIAVIVLIFLGILLALLMALRRR
jgi:hypothetical protein